MQPRRPLDQQHCGLCHGACRGDHEGVFTPTPYPVLDKSWAEVRLCGEVIPHARYELRAAGEHGPKIIIPNCSWDDLCSVQIKYIGPQKARRPA